MKHIFAIILGLAALCQLQAQSWTADNGNGTFTPCSTTISLPPTSTWKAIKAYTETGDMRLVDKESDASLFMWQDMLRNQCMLLSLKTNRYVGTDVLTGEPYAEERGGIRMGSSTMT